MRGFVVLLSYVVGLSAVIGIGMIVWHSINRRQSAAPVVATSQKERLANPTKQPTVAQRDAQPSQKRKVAHAARKRKEEAPAFSSGFSAYGYAQEPRHFNRYPSLFFSR